MIQFRVARPVAVKLVYIRMRIIPRTLPAIPFFIINFPNVIIIFIYFLTYVLQECCIKYKGCSPYCAKSKGEPTPPPSPPPPHTRLYN